MSMTTTPAPLALADRDGLAVIGRTLHDLRGIRFENEPGGANPAGSNPPAPAPAPPTPATPAGPNPPNPAPAPPAASTDPRVAALAAQQAAFTPEQTAAYILSLRTEAEQNRTAREAAEAQAREAAERQTAIYAALGLTPAGQTTPPDPAALQATIAEREAAVAQTARENLVLRVAGPLGANADRLLDSRSFLNRLSALKGDDRTGAEALVNEYIANDASYKVTTAAASSGGTSHTGTTPPNARANMADAVRARMGASAGTR